MPRPTPGSTWMPSSSGPRCLRARTIAASSSGGGPSDVSGDPAHGPRLSMREKRWRTIDSRDRLDSWSSRLVSACMSAVVAHLDGSGTIWHGSCARATFTNERAVEARASPWILGDFRLLSRRAMDTFNRLRERSRFVRGMVSWLGSPQAPVFYSRLRAGPGSPNILCAGWSTWRGTVSCCFPTFPFGLRAGLG
jgi:hypothetical protein